VRPRCGPSPIRDPYGHWSLGRRHQVLGSDPARPLPVIQRGTPLVKDAVAEHLGAPEGR
jgi:hypothetical protein